MANNVPAYNTFSLSSPNKGGYELKKLRANHHQILRMKAQGMKNVDIAKKLNCTPQTVYNTVNSELGQKKLAVLTGEADARTLDIMTEYKELSPLALAVQEEILLYGDKDETRLRASENILSGAGYGKKSTIEVNHNIPSQDEIEAARRKSLKSARDAGIIALDEEEEEEIQEAIIIDEDED